MVTWWFGLPTSPSHALVGGLVGAAPAAAQSVQWTCVLEGVVVAMVVSPPVGPGLGHLVMLGLLWSSRKAHVTRANRGSRRAQVVNSAAMALGHGMQDAQETMGTITLALFTAGELDTLEVPARVVLGAAAARSAGTYAGIRIMRTMGRRIIQPTPAGGFAAGDGGLQRHGDDGDRLRRPGVDDARPHDLVHGRGLDAPALGRPVGRRGQHPRRLGRHPARGRRGPTSSPTCSSADPPPEPAPTLADRVGAARAHLSATAVPRTGTDDAHKCIDLVDIAP